MTHKLICGECECCGTSNRVLHHATTGCGLEAYACALCRCGDLSDDLDNLEAEIEALQSKAENGEQWAHLCALEAAYAEAQAAFAETHGQFGVGA